MTRYLTPLLFLASLTAAANEVIGIPIGATLDPVTTGEVESTPRVVEGPFEGLFGLFDRYNAHLEVSSQKLARAEAQKVYSSFGICSEDTRQIWNYLKQTYGNPTADENQAWWFDMGDQQRISVNCKIYGNSGKIALNMIVIDNELVHVTGQ